MSVRRTTQIVVSTSERGGGKLAIGRGKHAHKHAYCVNRPRRFDEVSYRVNWPEEDGDRYSGSNTKRASHEPLERSRVHAADAR
jgi:hypothetical protein